MTSIVEELLKGMEDNETISYEIEETPEVQILLDGYQNYRKKFDSSLPLITIENNGREFKDALLALPAKTKLELFNKFTDALNKTNDSDQDSCEEIQLRKDHKKLIRLIVYSFFVLALIIIGTVTYLSINGKEIPSGEIFSAITTTIVEIIKVIAGL